VLPTDTLPKLRAAGLALSAMMEDVEAEVEDTALPFAEVTPVQPDRIMTDTKSVEVRKRIRARGVGRACGSVGGNRERDSLECVSMN